MTEYEQNILDRISQLIHEGKLSNEFLVSNLKLSCDYLNLKRLSDYEKETGKSTQGLRKQHKDKIIKICDFQLFIDND